MASHTVSQNPRYVLQLVVSCRKITAQVSDTSPATASIVAMASSSRQDFYPHYHSRLNPFPKRRRLWDSKTAALVGQKLGSQLSGQANQRMLVRPLFDSVRCAGVAVDGLEKLD